MLIIKRRIKYAEPLEDWELEYEPHRFSFKDLFQATERVQRESVTRELRLWYSVQRGVAFVEDGGCN